MHLGRWPIRSPEPRPAGLAPGIAMAGVLHLSVLLLAQGGHPSVVAEPPPALTLVSLPVPDLPTEPPAAAPEPPATPAPALPEAVAAAPDLAPVETAAQAALPSPPVPTEPDPTPEPPLAAAMPEPAPPPLPDLTAEAVLPSPPALPPQPPNVPQKRAAALPKPPARAEPAKVAPAKPALRPHPPAEAQRVTEALSSPSPPADPAPKPDASTLGASAAAEASFGERLRQVVQVEARRNYPAAARTMGLTGQAVVSFEYRDGAVRAAGLAQTSGSPLLDRAALAAVQNASYPAPPSELAGRTLAKRVHVKYELAPE